jgi:hypothetical protein
LQIYVASPGNKVTIIERAGEIKTNYIAAKDILNSLCPISEKFIYVLVGRQFLISSMYIFQLEMLSIVISKARAIDTFPRMVFDWDYFAIDMCMTLTISLK